jgi:hypothetical protein
MAGAVPGAARGSTGVVRILAIDGGGIRGIIPAMVLAEVERRTGRPARELFDLIAGTSTGGIIACALARPEPRPAAELVDLYRREGPDIFSRSLGRRVASAEGLLDEKYDDDALDTALARHLGDTRLRDARTRVLVTTYDLHGREPFVFRSWRSGADVSMAVAARATSAAPTYFEPVLFQGRSLIDGGVYAINPALTAYTEALRLRPSESPAEHVVVSLGTGKQTRRIEHDDARDWGQLEWARPLIGVVFDGAADAVESAMEAIAGERHHRFQVELTRGSDDLDDASADNLARLQDHARELIEESSAGLDAALRAVAR